jgi:hypothetical protein
MARLDTLKVEDPGRLFIMRSFDHDLKRTKEKSSLKVLKGISF